MNIVFMGTPMFAVASLSKLIEAGKNVPAVVTAPDKPKGRGLELAQSDMKKYAVSKGLKILQPTNLKSDDFLNELASLSPDLIVIVAFRILPPEVFEMPQHGSVNLHASLLPKYRGAAPINRAIMNGETETGVTTFFLKKKVDTGNIIMQANTKIDINDNAGFLHDRLADMGAELLLKTVSLIESGKEITLIQQDDSLATPAPKIFRNDCLIDWNNDSLKIHNHIRGLSPYPGAYTFLNSKVLKIFASKLTDAESSGAPGEIEISGKSIFVHTDDKLLELESLQPEGKRRMSSHEFIAGHPGISGVKLTST